MSESRKIVIVGGVAGGASAAARIRRLDENAKIVMFERTGYISYANCGLPYYIGNVITDKSELTLQTPRSFGTRFNVDVRVSHEVTSIDRAGKTVSVKNLLTGEEWAEPYDILVLSPGARPVIPDIPGNNLKNVFTLRTVEDTFRIKEFADEKKPERAVIFGGGFIGLELAENLVNEGIAVSIVQRSKQVMSPIDMEIASFVHARLRKAGINLVLGDTPKALEEREGAITVRLNSGASIEADMAVFAMGVVPETALANAAGLELGLKGSIVVDKHMRTSDPAIYAVGDAVQVRNYVSGSDAVISLAGPANRQARIAADNICGIESTYKGSMGSSVIKLFDQTLAFTGLNEKTCKASGIPYDKIFLSPSNHAGYYPGAKAMTMKVIFDRNADRILGAQIIGYEGVDKAIDVIATAIQTGMKASALKELDLAYAPPYSSAKSPVNMAGFMIENLENGLIKQYFYEDLDNIPKDGSANLIDVRTPGEYNAGHLDGFVNIPVDEIRDRLDEIDLSKPAYLMCQAAIRSWIAGRILIAKGVDCYHFAGGYRLYKSIATEKMAAEQTMPCGADK